MQAVLPSTRQGESRGARNEMKVRLSVCSADLQETHGCRDVVGQDEHTERARHLEVVGQCQHPGER